MVWVIEGKEYHRDGSVTYLTGFEVVAYPSIRPVVLCSMLVVLLSMQKVAVTVEEEHLYELKAMEHLFDCDSRSAAFRRLIAEYNETRREYDSLKAEYEELQTELEAVKNERKTLIRDREEKQELVKYVEDERTNEQRWRQAGLLKKVKYTVFGMDANGE